MAMLWNGVVVNGYVARVLSVDGVETCSVIMYHPSDGYIFFEVNLLQKKISQI